LHGSRQVSFSPEPQWTLALPGRVPHYFLLLRQSLLFRVSVLPRSRRALALLLSRLP
jgi:hypothetical protein